MTMPTTQNPAPTPAPASDPFAAFAGHSSPVNATPAPDPFTSFGGHADSSQASNPFSQFGGRSDESEQTSPQPASEQPVPSTWDRIKNLWHTATTTPIPELIGGLFGPRGEAAAKMAEAADPINVGLAIDKFLGDKLAGSKNRAASLAGKTISGIANAEQGGLRSSESPVGAVAAISGAEPLQEAAPVLSTVSKGVNAAFGTQGLLTLATPKKSNETPVQYAARLGSGIVQTGIALLAHHALTKGPIPSALVVDSDEAKNAAEQAQTVFHGTNAPVEDIEHLSADFSKPHATAGPGVYLTPEAHVASQYVGETPGGRVLAGKLAPVKLLDANAPLPASVTKILGLSKNASYYDALADIRDKYGFEKAAPQVKRLQLSVARAGYDGLDNLYTDRKAMMLLPDEVLPKGRKYGDLVTASLPTARIVSPDYVPAVSKNDVLAETTQRIFDNSDELQKAGVDASRIQTPGDVSRALDLASSHITRNLDPRVAATISLPVQRELASDLGMTIDELLSRRSGAAMNAEQAIAARSLLKQSTTDLLNNARLANMGDEAYLQKFRQSLARHQEIQNQVAGVRAEAGRALGSFRSATVESKLADSLAGLKPAALSKAAQLLSKVDPSDFRSVNSFIREIEPASTPDKIFEFYRNALLSSPHTAILKGVSENLMMALETAKKLAKGGIAQLKGDDSARVGDAYWYARGVTRAIPKAVKYAFTGKLDLRDAPDFEATGQQAIKGTPGKVVRLPQTVLSRQTNAMYVLNYSGELESQAARIAANEGLAGDELAARQEWLVNNPTQAMKDAANETALHNTFQRKLGTAGASTQRAIHQVPVARYLFPFFKTPINLVKESSYFSPYGFLKGTLTGDAEMQAKGLVGSSVLAGIARLVADGKITGGGPLQYQQRETLEDTGWQPYSLKIGGRYVSYHRAEPVGLLVGLVADAMHGMNPGGDPETANAKVQSAYNYILRNVDDLPFMMSLSDLLSTVDTHGNMNERIGNFLDREVAGFVPAAVGNAAQIADPTIRRPENLLESIEAKVPGLTENVPPVLDAEGNPVKTPASKLGGANPFPVSSQNSDPVIRELGRLGLSTPRVPTFIKLHGQTFPLTPAAGQRMYRNERQKLTQQLGSFIGSRAYAAMNDEQRVKAIQRLQQRENTTGKIATIGEILAAKNQSLR